jgi:hypothetical protein
MKAKVRSTFVPALLVLLGAFSSPRSASADTYEVSIGSTARWMPSSTIDAIADDDSHLAFSLGVAFKLNRVSVPFVDLYLDAMLETGGVDGETFQRIDTEAGLLSGTLGVRAQRDLSPRLAGFGRAALGVARVSLSMTDGYSYSEAMKDHGNAGAVYLGAGADFIALRKPWRPGSKTTVTMGLRAEFGYSAITCVPMRALSESGGDGAITIPTQATSVGGLDMSAWSFRLGLVWRI